MVERQVLVLQGLEVAQHGVLGVMRVEHRMGENGRSAAQLVRNGVGAGRVEVRGLAEQGQQRGDIFARGGLVKADADGFVVAHFSPDIAHVEGGIPQCRRPASADFCNDRVEKISGNAEAAGEQAGEAMDAPGDALQALRAVPDGIHAGHVGEQHLRGADVRVGLFAADVLFARLQGHAQGRLAAHVFRDADDAAGHGALVLVLAGEESGVRAAVAQRHAEALRRTEGDVRAHFTGRFRQHQRKQIASDSADGVLCLERGDDRAEILDLATGVGGLQESAEHVVIGSGLGRADDQFETEQGGPRAHDIERLGKRIRIDKEGIAGRLADAARHRHRFGGGGGFVE